MPTLDHCRSTDALTGAGGAELSFDTNFGLNRLKNFFLAESLESVDTCLCLTGTGAGGGMGDWARDEGVFNISES